MGYGVHTVELYSSSNSSAVSVVCHHVVPMSVQFDTSNFLGGHKMGTTIIKENIG